MTYNQLKAICDTREISMTDVASMAEISVDGIRKGLSSRSLAMRYIEKICRAVGITPNQLFEFHSDSDGDVNYGSMNKNGKKQILHVGSVPAELKSTIEMLKDQLKAKDEQIKAKDEQIKAKDEQIKTKDEQIAQFIAKL